jgi:hypothetical protein
MYRKSDDFPLDFGQIMAIENLKNNFFSIFHFYFHFWLYTDHQQKNLKAGS